MMISVYLYLYRRKFKQLHFFYYCCCCCCLFISFAVCMRLRFVYYIVFVRLNYTFDVSIDDSTQLETTHTISIDSFAPCQPIRRSIETDQPTDRRRDISPGLDDYLISFYFTLNFFLFNILNRFVQKIIEKQKEISLFINIEFYLFSFYFYLD